LEINDCETAAAILVKAVGRRQRDHLWTVLDRRQSALVENFRSHWKETFAVESECRARMQMLAKPALAPVSETRGSADQQAATS